MNSSSPRLGCTLLLLLTGRTSEATEHLRGRGKARWTMRWKPALHAFAITFAASSSDPLLRTPDQWSAGQYPRAATLQWVARERGPSISASRTISRLMVVRRYLLTTCDTSRAA